MHSNMKINSQTELKSVAKQYTCIMQKVAINFCRKALREKKEKRDLPTYSWECKFMSIFTTYPLLPLSHTKWLIIYTFRFFFLVVKRENLFNKIWKLNPFCSHSTVDRRPHRHAKLSAVFFFRVSVESREKSLFFPEAFNSKQNLKVRVEEKVFHSFISPPFWHAKRHRGKFISYLWLFDQNRRTGFHLQHGEQRRELMTKVLINEPLWSIKNRLIIDNLDELLRGQWWRVLEINCSNYANRY